MKVAIVVPAYNEEEGITETISRLNKIVRDIKYETDIIIVNDGSKDRTADMVRASGVRLINYIQNSGKGAALKKAFKTIRADVLVTTDADCTYEVEKIPNMIEILKNENADLVVGSRFVGKIRDSMPLLNWLGNKIFSLIVEILTGIKTTDASSGLRVFRRNAIESLGIQANGLDYEIEMTVRANKKRLKVIEVPIIYEKRVGKSKLRPITDGWRFLMAIIHSILT